MHVSKICIAEIYERQIIMKNAELSRRSFIGGTAALSAATMLPNLANAAKPNSTFNGVQIGVMSGCFVKMSDGSAELMLKYITQCGISSVEMRTNEAEQYAKAYAKTHPGSDPMDGFKALRKLYNDAGEGLPGTFLPFEFNVTKEARVSADNTIVVKVTNKRLDEVGTGGIVSPVMLWSPKR